MRQDARAVSEFAGVAILVSLTVLVTASVGVYVLVAETNPGEGPRANFSFEYVESSSVLLVTHERGDEIPAGNLTVRSGDPEGGQARWNEIAGSNETALVAPGDTVQVGNNNAYGERVGGQDSVEVVYAPVGGNETVLETWDGN